ncbi:MAG TPA: MOSC domain-containing protein, partial [Dehalococcoidia bacterium]|nr:MOSC domain-containing protein [Dehalococcoidia bacterium]
MSIGTLASIFIAPSAEAAMVSVLEVRAIPSRGLEGDRYFRAADPFSRGHELDADLTLIEAEAIEALARER